MGKRWSPELDKYLDENYATTPMVEMVEYTGKNEKAIYYHAQCRKLVKSCRIRRVNAEVENENRDTIIKYAEFKTDEWIAERLGIEVSKVEEIRKKVLVNGKPVTNYSLCTYCKKSTNIYLKCPWCQEFKPVQGWVAEFKPVKNPVTVDGKHIYVKQDSYFVKDCPLYERG